MKERRLRGITLCLYGAIEKRTILLSQYWERNSFIAIYLFRILGAPKIFSLILHMILDKLYIDHS